MEEVDYFIRPEKRKKKLSLAGRGNGDGNGKTRPPLPVSRSVRGCAEITGNRESGIGDRGSESGVWCGGYIKRLMDGLIDGPFPCTMMPTGTLRRVVHFFFFSLAYPSFPPFPSATLTSSPLPTSRRNSRRNHPPPTPTSPFLSNYPLSMQTKQPSSISR